MHRDSWKFAGFEFSSAFGLKRAGVPVLLQPKPRMLLELLLRAQGNIVSKDSIAVALWPDGSPSDASIARAVSGLRKGVGASHMELVRTIYGGGVQLACDIDAFAGDDPDNREAIASLLQTGWELVSDRRPDSHQRTLEVLRHASQRFPHSAVIWATIADLHASMAVRGILAPSIAAKTISRSCQSALQADPDCSQALAVSG